VDVIAVDCGGSNLRAATANADGGLGTIVRAPTPEDLSDLAAAIAGLIGDPGGARAVGVGVSGLVDHATGTLHWTPHRPGTEVALRADLERRLGLPVVVDNDANLAALAEARLGSGAGHRMVLTVTVGTGIGGGLVIAGEIERGRGHLGEIGHVVVDPTGPACACGLAGCWETVASGRALDQAARSLAAMARGTLAGRDDADGTDLVTAAEAGDTAAAGALEAVAAAFGHGLASLIATFDPDVIVVGGGVGVLGERLLAPARRAMMDAIPGAAHRRETPVLPARFGADAGLVGAALAAGGVLR
jgi:glucokinase